MRNVVMLPDWKNSENFALGIYLSILKDSFNFKKPRDFMSYHVVPFDPNISSTQSGKATASTLEQLINSKESKGWEFVDVKQIDGFKAGSSGCFGIGAQPGEPITVSVVIFKE